jgi:hypothetical protein
MQLQTVCDSANVKHQAAFAHDSLDIVSLYFTLNFFSLKSSLIIQIPHSRI